MDKLQAILAAKKGQAKIVVNKQVLEKQQQKFAQERQQFKKQTQQKKKRKIEQLNEFYSHSRKLIKKNEQLSKDAQNSIIEKSQVIAKLRQLNQPITLFGETDSDRFRRYIRLTKQLKGSIQTNKNKFYDQAYQRKIKEAKQYEQLDAKYRFKMIEPRILDDINLRQAKLKMIENEKNISYDEICDSVFLWISKVLRDWNQAFQHKYHSLPQKISSKINYSRYEETVSDLATFIKVLKAKAGDKEMITSIYHIMNCCLVREFGQANDKYIQLSIGNAPWPMGVAMLGITVKKNAQRLSHVLNQQMTRKWIQGIKRLMSVSQQLYPNQDKTKMVGYSVNSMI